MSVLAVYKIAFLYVSDVRMSVSVTRVVGLIEKMCMNVLFVSVLVSWVAPVAALGPLGPSFPLMLAVLPVIVVCTISTSPCVMLALF